MGLFDRKPNICALAAQLERIEQQLHVIENDGACLPSMVEMKSLAWMRFALPQLTDYADTLEKTLWQRVEVWRNTPYTPAQLLRKRVISFIGWWFAATMTLATAVLGWFTPLFTKPWHMLVTSAILGLIIVIVIAFRERGFLDPH
jgi:hypothetical protein